MSYRTRVDSPPPHKLLACDGGGIRGIISVEILARIETELPAASGKPDLVLAHYFDHVAGTSTGANYHAGEFDGTLGFGCSPYASAQKAGGHS